MPLLLEQREPWNKDSKYIIQTHLYTHIRLRTSAWDAQSMFVFLLSVHEASIPLPCETSLVQASAVRRRPHSGL